MLFTSCLKVGPYAAVEHPQEMLSMPDDQAALAWVRLQAAHRGAGGIYRGPPSVPSLDAGQRAEHGQLTRDGATAPRHSGQMELTARGSNGSSVLESSGSYVTVTWKGVPWLAPPLQYWVGMWLQVSRAPLKVGCSGAGAAPRARRLSDALGRPPPAVIVPFCILPVPPVELFGVCVAGRKPYGHSTDQVSLHSAVRPVGACRPKQRGASSKASSKARQRRASRPAAPSFSHPNGARPCALPHALAPSPTLSPTDPVPRGLLTLFRV